MEDIWSTRDLPVLRAIVEIYDSTGRPIIRPRDITSATGFDEETVQRAVRALHREPYLTEGTESWGGKYVFVGIPTGDALRVSGLWPTPETQLDRLIAALLRAADDEEPRRGTGQAEAGRHLARFVRVAGGDRRAGRRRRNPAQQLGRARRVTYRPTAAR